MSKYIAVVLVAMGGFFVRSLSLSGAVATMLVGTAVAVSFSWQGLCLLGLFFGTSSFWSHFRHQQKQLLAEKIEKGAQRDYVQVFANGSIPAAISLLALAFPHWSWQGLFAVSIAAANADTWASEIGSVSRQSPRMITTWKKVESGTSGAVTSLGTLASFFGAFVIAIVADLLWHDISIVAVSILGFLGSALDTYIGAVWQASYRCTVCGMETEKRKHCGKQTIRIKGQDWLNNDVVNWLSIFCSTIVYFFVIKL
ncbi:DUF92 domain-containing protein [Anoxybacteroides amylolyticum]|uniref:Cytidylyltransferase family protein n=1 Tax=Anoxybacteroides amylolyticum TaxID=294699 RepID=A0A160F5W5_9BACL|nr:DUF92 domain-containing protein [Anoxybacillus amylolyticus]ANB61551.1 hypothetical protein GFC30_2644 [Anoxybacillus amylolyticus]